jgi:hypothetical protein
VQFAWRPRSRLAEPGAGRPTTNWLNPKRQRHRHTANRLLQKKRKYLPRRELFKLLPNSYAPSRSNSVDRLSDWSTPMKRLVVMLIASSALFTMLSVSARADTPSQSQCQGSAAYCNVYFGH